MQALLENLYSQQTTFWGNRLSSLCVHLNKRVNKRSLLVLYTNFSGIGSLNRQLAYLQQLNRQHWLLVIFFEDAALKEYVATPARDGRIIPPCHCREICIRETADSLHLEAARHQFCADYTGKSFCGRDKQVSGDLVT